MSLAWATVAVLVLLLPGFLFFVGIYVPEDFTRDVAPRSGLDLPTVFSAVELPVDEFGRSELAASLTANRWWIYSYFGTSAVAGFLLGWLLGVRALAGGFSSFLVQHRWVHELDLEDSDGNAITYAYVMTNLHAGDRYLLYRGVLKQFALTREGTFAYLVLRKPRRSYMLLASGQPVVLQNFHQIGSSAGVVTKADPLLVIEGEDVANVVFEAKPYDEDKEARSALAAILKRLPQALSSRT